MNRNLYATGIFFMSISIVAIKEQKMFNYDQEYF